MIVVAAVAGTAVRLLVWRTPVVAGCLGCFERIPNQAANQRNKRVKGIEPSCAAWEAAVLPLNYTRASKNGEW